MLQYITIFVQVQDNSSIDRPVKVHHIGKISNFKNHSWTNNKTMVAEVDHLASNKKQIIPVSIVCEHAGVSIQLRALLLEIL